MTRRSVTVVGGGVAGLSAALALALAGWRVSLRERSDAFGETGAGLQLGANAQAALSRLGCLEAARRDSTPLPEIWLRDGRGGRVISRQGFARAGHPPNLAIHRADFVRVLADAAEAAGVDVCFGAAVGEPWDIESDAVVLADGVKAPVSRAALGFPAPAFTGQVAWRALVPGGEGGDRAEVHMAPGAHMVTYPLRRGKLLNVVAVEERSGWAEEGWSIPGDPSLFRDIFGGFSGRAGDAARLADEVSVWGLFKRPVPRTWHAGKVGAVGDAVHPTLPFLAQGAGMALEDAVVLAPCLTNAPSVGEGWERFTESRRNRVVRIVAAADRNAWLYHLRPPLSWAAGAGLSLGDRIAPGAALRQFDWLLGWRP